MTVIKDGTGQGFLAGVAKNNRLFVDAVTIPEIAFHSLEEGTAFQLEGEALITAATETTVLIIINDESEKLISIERFLVSIQGESGKITTIKAYIGNATVSGGTTKSLVNLNTTSVQTLSVTARENVAPASIGGTDSRIQENYMELTETIEFLYIGAIILGRLGSFRVTCTGAAGAAGTKNCDASFLLFNVDPAEH